VSVFHIEEEINIRTWDDIFNRPGYQSPVEAGKFRFLRIAAVYSFKEQSAHCGLSDCQQVHRRGFLVITSDEKETNLCEACGQRLLDMTSNNSKHDLQDLARVRARQIRLNKVLEQSDVIKRRVKELKQAPKGANWLYQMLTMFRKTYPIDLLAALKELATNKNDNAILAAIIENETDPSQLERVEQLQGLGIFAADIREELIGKILKPLIELEELAGNPEANTSLPRYCRWADNLEDQFTCAERLVEEGRAFFEKENLQRLKQIPLSEVSTRFMQSVRWKGDSVITKRK
jgi:hypothetical protein